MSMRHCLGGDIWATTMGDKIVLTIHNEDGFPTQEIVLSRPIYQNLVEFIERFKDEQAPKTCQCPIHVQHPCSGTADYIAEIEGKDYYLCEHCTYGSYKNVRSLRDAGRHSRLRQRYDL